MMIIMIIMMIMMIIMMKMMVLMITAKEIIISGINNSVHLNDS